MKLIKTLLLALCVFQTNGQTANYYLSAEGKGGNALRSELNGIISNNTVIPYTSSSNIDTWDVLKLSDANSSNPANVNLIYSGSTTNGAQEYNGGNGWNREHVWPQSFGASTSQPVGTDVHNLKPADPSLNSLRSNLEFDDLGNFGSTVYYDGVPTGCKYSSSMGVFEPRNDIKGDLARIILYMDLRYEGIGNEPDLTVQENLNTGGFTFAVLSTLLQWHQDDPVDAFETNRNNIIYNYQGNRNPFIDYPELVDYLYGSNTSASWNPSSVNPPAPSGPCTNLFFSEYAEGSSYNKYFEIYNPSNAPISLSGYTVYLSGNGGSFTNTFSSNAVIDSNDVFVIAHASANSAILALADTALSGYSVANFNGDDALILVNGTDTIDVIGVPGVDPGSSWAVGSADTKDNTLVRM
ncbi:MAG: endonuclease, partial [Bacteroidota bacterium]|nr:endonuclease [Bacteroidota bacterium]